ncbi:MAG: TonB-dependent receptor [Oceanicaulis sp.]
MFKFTVSAAALLAGLAAAPALAQSETDRDEPVAVDTIVIRGEKVDQDLQETVTSVGVVTGDQLELDGIASLGDAFDYIANVNRNNSEGGFSIRGIPFDNLLGAGSAPLAQIYVDGVTLGDQTTRFNADTIWDVDQVEVLRGAQSTVQGRNALAGAIIINTADPSYDFEGRARAQHLTTDESDMAYILSAAYGGPIVADTLAFRVAVERRESDGFVDNAVTGEDGADFNDQWQARVKLLFEPTDTLSSQITVNYSQAKVADALSDRRRVGPNGFVSLTDVVPGNEDLRLTYVNAPDFNQNTNLSYAWRNTWDISDAFTLTSLTTYSDAENDERLDTDGTNVDPATYPQTPVTLNNPFNIPTIPSGQYTYAPEGTQLEEQSIFTQEFTLAYDEGGRFRGLAGAYYVDSQEEEYNFTPGIQPGILAVVEGASRPGIEAALRAQLGPLRGIPAPGNPVAGIPAGPAGDPFFDAFIAGATDASTAAVLANYTDIGAFIAMTSEPLDVQNYAFYARGEYDVTDRLTVGFGLRYDHEEQVEGLTLSGDPLGLPNPAAPALPAGFPAALIPVVQGTIAAVNATFDASLLEANTSASQSFSAWLPSGFVSYDIDEDRTVIFSVRRGYRAGGSDLNIPRQFVSQFDPEYTTNYELALRSFWLDRRLRVNANAFYTDWTDQQVVVSLSTLQQDEVGFNVGSSTLYGFEIDTSLQIDRNWSLDASLGHVKTEFEDFDAALAAVLIDAQGETAPIDLEQTLAAFENNSFSFAPEWTGSARLAYEGDRGWYGVLGVTYEGESFVNNSNSGAATFLNNDARTLVNLTLGKRVLNDQVTVSVLARNLFDETYVASGGNERVRLGAPRQFGVRVAADF